MRRPEYPNTIDRRGFLGAASSLVVAAATSGGRRVWSAERAERPRIAAIVTEYRSLSHADVILGRLLTGYILSTTETYSPRVQIASMYVDQFPAGDLSREMASEYDVAIQPTIGEALMMGTGRLAVDGVLIIGEHGDYPDNAKGQKMYPRRRFFEETVKTFSSTGATAPVFNDKHLGFAWEDAKWMYDQSRQMKFPLMAGSSVPTAWRRPDVELPLGVELESAVAIGYSGIEIYGFHTLEMLQCMVERRRGGESGVRAVTCLEGAAVWKAASSGKWSRELLDAAAACLPDRSQEPPERVCQNPVAFLIENSDGFRSVALLLDGFTVQFGFACQIKGSAVPVATSFWLQEPGYGHFSYLVHNIESMYLTGREPYPPERTLLTTGILDAAMTSRFEGHRRIETPWLVDVAYKVSGAKCRRAKF